MWPGYLSFSISPSNEYPELISCKTDLFDLFAIKGNLKSLLQHRSLKTSTLRRLPFFMVQLSHPYLTTGKTIALTIWTFDGKVVFMLFNSLSLSYEKMIDDLKLWVAVFRQNGVVKCSFHPSRVENMVKDMDCKRIGQVQGESTGKEVEGNRWC